MKLARDTVLSGRYLIKALLGEGGMGVVYRAVDKQLGRQVAIKTIQGDRASDRAFLKRFRREAIAISQIEHPHIVRLFEFVEAQGDQLPYMVMELLSGLDLGTVIRKTGPLDVTRAVTRTLEASVAIAECHRFGYLHRDVKPPNIFLHTYNQVETAKVLDFGAVKQDEGRARQGGEDTADLTKEGTLFGTPFYMPPEQIAGKAVTTKSDQYSLGVVLYTALAGRKPFEIRGEHKDFELLQAIMKGDFTPIQKLRSDVPPGVAEAVQKAMSLDPNDRFFDLHAFGAALRPYASQQARLTWEAHFTSSAPLPRSLNVSIAISAFDGSVASVGSALDAETIVDPSAARRDPTHGTGPTVPAKHGEPTTPQDSGTRSLSFEIEEASQVSEGGSSAPRAREPGGETTARSFLRDKPLLLVGGAVVALGVALAASFLLSHRKAPAPLVASPPPELFNRPAAAPPAAAAPLPPAPHPRPVIAPAPVPQPAGPSGSPLAQPEEGEPAAASKQQTAPSSKHHHHKKVVRQAVDAHGIPIPTD